MFASPSFSRLVALAAFALAPVLACGGRADGGNPADAEVDSGADSGCSGSWLYGCSNGRLGPTVCCPAGAHCLPPGGFCDLGGGACAPGLCPVDGAAPDAPITDASGTGACQTSADCHKSNPDECTICVDTSLVCHMGSCVCACQIGD